MSDHVNIIWMIKVFFFRLCYLACDPLTDLTSSKDCNFKCSYKDSEMWQGIKEDSLMRTVLQMLNSNPFFQYHPSVQMEGANRELACQLLEKANEVNVVQALVEAEHLNTQRRIRLNAQHVPDFLILDLHFLRDLTVGIYQIHLAPSYIHDKLQREESEEFQIEMLRDVQRIPQPGLIRVRVYSRFRNAAKYQLWISYRPTNDHDMDDGMDVQDGPHIQGYYCTCKSGARTLGEELANNILKAVTELGLDLMKIRGQGYNGAASMSGNFNGVKTHILNKYPLAKSLRELGMYPYHFTPVQNLFPADYQRRERFCQWYLNLDINISLKILWTDESTFTRVRWVPSL
nr:PREDICTED: uncharacterized protein LOC105669368 [Linepithema humile]